MNNGSYRNSHLSKGSDYDADLSIGNFDSYMVSHESEILARVVQSIFPDKVPRYLDFACGTGRILSTVEPYTEESFGVDVSESMVSEAKNKCKKTVFHIADITSTPTPTIDNIDLATAFRFFGNAEQQLRVSVLDALSGIVRPGGYLITNNHRNPGSLHERLLRLKGEPGSLDLSHSNLTTLLNNSGFTIERKIGIGLWIYRHSLRRDAANSNSVLRHLEPLSKLNALATLCPDYIVIARKQH